MDAFAALTDTLRRQCPGLELRTDEPMARHTSFRVGGPVRLMALPKTAEQATAVVAEAYALGIVPFYMGNGSNLLVADSGWPGLVVKTFDGLGEISVAGQMVEAGSGVLLSRLANAALAHGLTGLEFAHGIPGSLGGAVTMDAGAYGGEMRQVVTETDALTAQGTPVTLRGEAHCFGYRTSAYADGSRLILRVRLRLEPGEPEIIRAKMDELSRCRRAKQPLEWPSAGSTFKRPEGHFAAGLIEQCGLKGAAIGGAQISEKHAGFLINRGGASCEDILKLMALVQEQVCQRTGVVLEPEVKLLGCKL